MEKNKYSPAYYYKLYTGKKLYYRENLTAKFPVKNYVSPPKMQTRFNFKSVKITYCS